MRDARGINALSVSPFRNISRPTFRRTLASSDWYMMTEEFALTNDSSSASARVYDADASAFFPMPASKSPMTLSVSATWYLKSVAAGLAFDSAS